MYFRKIAQCRLSWFIADLNMQMYFNLDYMSKTCAISNTVENRGHLFLISVFKSN